jgi:hypothetical protein
VLVMPNLDAANISYNLLKMTGGDGMSVGPILLGAARPVHVLAADVDGSPSGGHDRPDRRGRSQQVGAQCRPACGNCQPSPMRGHWN